ncbi:MAG: PIN domain-containing protein [Chloroflexota bacterium]|nr:PIN domain-containing protein [Chloroflexota bacterium]MDE2686247.1 PIN domain-containing protein [Chloroflexota bacterium]MYC05888.1 type II toxin-antitoxin system VapC family toxin [Chloroflexota bacterium]
MNSAALLIDSNIWLERLLDQDRASEVERFLAETPSELLYITDFALHSICLILQRVNQPDTLRVFVNDLFSQGGVKLVRLNPSDIHNIVDVIQEFELDFDDAYQYVAAEKFGLTIVSFDADFNRTARGHKLPGDILQQRYSECEE